jgi:hypothetical protein
MPSARVRGRLGQKTRLLLVGLQDFVARNSVDRCGGEA